MVFEQDLTATYRSDGLIIIDQPDSVREQLQAYKQECALWFEQYSGHKLSAKDLAGSIAEVADQKREEIALLYKVARRFAPARRIACNEELISLAAQLMETKSVSCCHFVNFRIDLKGEEKFLLNNHQDFPYIQGSLNGLTMWIPLGPISPELGPPSFARGTHRNGVYPVEEFDLASVGGSGGRSFRIVEKAVPPDLHFEPLEMSENQLAVFSTLLLHRSNPNTSDTARLSLQVRFDDALAPESTDRGFPEGLFLGDFLSNTYPEYVTCAS